ncbi:MAG: NifB/NifX family molybdenum-iron cluster-binding protein [Fervidobacterium sp.]
MVRIAIPTDDGTTVAPYFGKAEHFVVVEIQEAKEISRKLVENLHARGHHGGYHHGYHYGHHHENGGHGYHYGYHHENGGHGYHYGHHHENGGHGHGHEEVFESIGDIDGVIAVRIGPHMFEDLKDRNIGVYLVRVGTSIDNAINEFIQGKLRNIIKK